MRYFKNFVITLILILSFNSSFASEIYFVDVKKILNESVAGKQAQYFLKKKFDTENKKLEKEAAALKKEESDLISKKKLVSKEEYKKSLDSLRTKSINFHKHSLYDFITFIRCARS